MHTPVIQTNAKAIMASRKRKLSVNPSIATIFSVLARSICIGGSHARAQQQAKLRKPAPSPAEGSARQATFLSSKRFVFKRGLWSSAKSSWRFTMMLRTAASVAALTLALGVAGAAAQTTAPQQSTAPGAPPATTEVSKMPVAGQIVVQDANTILAKDLIGQTVYAPDKVKIGSISDLILSKDAKTVEGFVIGVGGFLGLGEKSVALKIDRLQMTQDAENGLRLMMDVKKEELANAPSFKSKRDQDAEKQAAERARERPQIPGQPGSPTQRPRMN
jgi:hypothetical protein